MLHRTCRFLREPISMLGRICHGCLLRDRITGTTTRLPAAFEQLHSPGGNDIRFFTGHYRVLRCSSSLYKRPINAMEMDTVVSICRSSPKFLLICHA